MFVTVKYQLPWRLWRQVLQAHDCDPELAHATLATAFLVAAENCTVRHYQAPRPYGVLAPGSTPRRRQAPSLEVQEIQLPSQEDPDPWAGARD